MSDEIIQYTDEDEADYQALLSKLDQLPLPADDHRFDFDKITGNAAQRTAKAIILYQVCENLWTVQELALKLRAKPETVRRYLYEALSEGIPEEHKELLRGVELQKTQVIDKRAMEQFKRSCDDEESVTTKWVVEVETDRGTIKEIEVAEGTPDAKEVIKKVSTGQSGNPAYLRIMQKNIELRAKLLGLEAPRQVEIDKTDRQLKITEVIVRSREEVEAARAAGLLK